MKNLGPHSAQRTTDHANRLGMTITDSASRAHAAPSRAARSLLTEDQVADRLGLSKRTLQSWRVTGSGPVFVRISARAVRYRPEDVESWISDRLRSSTSDPGR